MTVKMIFLVCLIASFLCLTHSFLSPRPVVSVRTQTNSNANTNTNAREISMKFNLGDFLSGKAAVEAEKRLNPSLFKRDRNVNANDKAKTNTNTKNKPIKITESMQKSIDIFRKEYNKSKFKNNRNFDVTDNDLSIAYTQLQKAVRTNDDDTLKIISNYPFLLSLNACATDAGSEKVAKNFATYER